MIFIIQNFLLDFGFRFFILGSEVPDCILNQKVPDCILNQNIESEVAIKLLPYCLKVTS